MSKKDIKALPLDLALVGDAETIYIRYMDFLETDGKLYYSDSLKAFVLFEKEGKFIYIQFHKTRFDKLTKKDHETIMDEVCLDSECTLYDYFMSRHKVTHDQVIKSPTNQMMRH